MHKWKIIHIENSQAYLDVMKRCFEKEKEIEYHAVHVISKEDAWSKLDNIFELPDLLIVDLMIENDQDPKPGVDLIKRIKEDERFKDLKIVALTATTKKYPRRALDGLVARYDTKTFRPSKWKEDIKTILESKGENLHE